jgi:outer membrane lipoprotein-sorting protein
MVRSSFLIFLFFTTISFIGDKEEKLLRSLQEKFETINDLTVDIVQRTNSREVFAGKLSYKQENKFYLDLKNILVVSNGSTLWNYNKSQNKVIINEVDKTYPSFFSFNRIVYDYPSECAITFEKGDDSDILIFVPKENSNLSFYKAKLWITKDYLISKIVLNGGGSENVEVVFSNYNLNQSLEDSKFIFNPPEGSTIIDFR